MKKITFLVFSLVFISFNREVLKVEASASTSEAIEMHSLSLAEMTHRVEEAVRVLNEYEATFDSNRQFLMWYEPYAVRSFYYYYGWVMDELESFNQTGSALDAYTVIGATYDTLALLQRSPARLAIIINGAHNLSSDLDYIWSLKFDPFS